MSTNTCYNELQEGQFRILHIAEVDGRISCTTEDVSFDNPPEYEAVSYSWGKADMTSTLDCNGCFLSVTPQLLEILQYLHKYGQAPHCPIWIDGVCINQQNYMERNIQVPRMREIYSKARNTLVWLGSPTKDTDLAMDKISSLSVRLAKINRVIHPVDFPLYGLEAKDDPVWQALGILFSRDWFHRLWVVQEAVLSAKIMVICGSKSVDWGIITSFYNAIHKTGLPHLMLGDYEVRQFRSDGFFGISLILRAKNILSRWPGYEVLPILCEGRSKQCTESVDRIWGFLGLFDSETRGKIVRSGWIDYSLDGKEQYWRTYVNIGKWIIENQDPTFNLLSLASSKERHPHLPSWCPDWNYSQECNAFVAVTSYRAGFGAVEPRHSRIKVTLESNNIKIPGFQIDTVEKVADSFYTFSQKYDRVQGPTGKAAELLRWEAECLKISQQVYSQPNAVPEAHWRTLIGNRIGQKSCEQDLFDDYRKWKNDLLLKRENKIGSLTSSELSAVNLYSSAVYTACQGRKFFSTRGGRIGIGPTQLETCDAVCVLYGGGPLYILRFEPGKEVVKLVGDAYVHGLMGGEALSIENEKTGRDFIIG